DVEPFKVAGGGEEPLEGGRGGPPRPLEARGRQGGVGQKQDPVGHALSPFRKGGPALRRPPIAPPALSPPPTWRPPGDAWANLWRNSTQRRSRTRLNKTTARSDREGPDSVRLLVAGNRAATAQLRRAEASDEYGVAAARFAATARSAAAV